MIMILISSAATIRRINNNGIKKMCRNIFAVQHTLTASITGRRELALDRAKHFNELCNLTPKDILNTAMFKELDYINVLQLLNRSSQYPDNDLLQQNTGKLSDILRNVGVTV